MLFADFAREMRHYGIEVMAPTGGGLRFKLKKRIDDAWVIYIVARHKNRIDDVYVRKTRRRFHLTPDDGVSNAEFDAV